MREISSTLSRWLADGESAGVATVVRVSGSAPRQIGATFVATRNGKMAGSVSNGCVEAQVYEELILAIERNAARLVRYGISDDFAFSVGLSCGGVIDVLCEPVLPVHEGALSAIGNGNSLVLARVLDPVEIAGTRAFLTDQGRASGFEAALGPLHAVAQSVLAAGSSREITTRLANGSEATVLLDVVSSPIRLVIVGATDVAMTLARLGRTLRMEVTIVDPRPALLNAERFGDDVRLILEWPTEALPALQLGDRTAVVVLSHDSKFDQPALRAALPSRAVYVGAIGSRRTNEARLSWLREHGLDEEEIKRLHSPIGLNIGARSPDEIALAILAEIIATVRLPRSS